MDDSIHYAATTKGEKLWLKVLYTRLIPRRLSFSEIRFETTRPGPQWFPDPAVPIVNSKLDENMEFAHSPSNLHTDAEPASSLGRRRSGELQISNRPAAGKPCAPAPARCPTSLGEAAETDHCQSTSCGPGCPKFGLIGASPCSSSSRKQSLAGAARVFVCSGPGKFAVGTWKTQRSEGCAQTHSEVESR